MFGVRAVVRRVIGKRSAENLPGMFSGFVVKGGNKMKYTKKYMRQVALTVYFDLVTILSEKSNALGNDQLGEDVFNEVYQLFRKGK